MINQIRLVEIELHSECNRTCSFCPNSYIDRKFYKQLDENVFKNLIDELAFNGYNQTISFSRYNEPFMHKELLIERIRYIREKLPGVKLVTNTNGDFDMNGVDLDEITEMDYDGNKEIIELDNFRVMRLGKINNRGGALKQVHYKKPRNFPCFEPNHFVGIDYTGDVVPCCNLRHDVKKHQPYILGNLKDNSLENILNSKKAEIFRYAVNSGRFDLFPEPCKYCLKLEGRYTKEEGGLYGDRKEKD